MLEKPTHNIVALYGTPADPAHFRKYYVETHLPLASKLPGLRGMHYSFAVETLGEGPAYFCFWTGKFDDRAAADAAMQSPEGEALAADVANYASGGITMLRYSAEGLAG